MSLPIIKKDELYSRSLHSLYLEFLTDVVMGRNSANTFVVERFPSLSQSGGLGCRSSISKLLLIARDVWSAVPSVDLMLLW